MPHRVPGRQGRGSTVRYSREDQPLVLFLAGELPENERAHLEERFLRDENLHLRLRSLEHELADDYARGEMDPSIRAPYETTLAEMPHRRRQVEFARELMGALGEEAPKHRQFRAAQVWRWAAAAALVLVFAGAVLRLQQFEQRTIEAERELAEVIRKGEGLSREIAQSQRTVQDLEARVQSLQAERPVAARAGLMVAAFLTPGSVRGASETVSIVIPRKAQSLRLQLDLEEKGRYTSYRVRVQTAGGRLVWGETGLKPRTGDRGTMLEVVVPAALIPAGEYEIALFGVRGEAQPEETGSYHFDAAR